MRIVVFNQKEEIVFFKNDNDIKVKERQWKCSRLKECRQKWQLNGVLDSCLDPEPERGNAIKNVTRPTEKNWIRTVS